MFGFNKKDTKIISLILLLIISLTLFNFQTSLRKARDNQRKNDLRSIFDALNIYQDEEGSFPASSSDGRIMACDGKLGESNIMIYEPCEWYQSTLTNLQMLPGDPRQGQGRSYYYISNQKHYQIYAALESNREAEYDQSIVSRNLPCGKHICNFGRGDGKTPLDKSLEEYENELLEQNK